ncbi:hypothetical protein B0T10DRAFT_502070 [Thelonectria olida]|uniref:Uncharacterized protein n=1 Tax=Thelonectria olida TaxID=1576542 RepID=A0A9P8VN29_9HYPO|nr:hypothetical protein B0T10DRAFT_502070 [Thelonectria olida]
MKLLSTNGPFLKTVVGALALGSTFEPVGASPEPLSDRAVAPTVTVTATRTQFVTTRTTETATRTQFVTTRITVAATHTQFVTTRITVTQTHSCVPRTVTQPASTVSLPASTVTLPVSTVTLPASTVTTTLSPTSTTSATPQCEANSDCPTPGNACQTVTCSQNTCVVSNVAVGTRVSDRTPGDCQKDVCDGQGGIRTVDDNTDLPADDGNPCTFETCVAGMPAHPQVPDGTSCGSDQTCLSGVCQ